MEVVVPATAADFIFDSASSTPYVSAPSSPRPMGGADWPSARHYYTSAPTSPSRTAAIFRDFSAAMAAGLPSPRPSSPHRSSVLPFEDDDDAASAAASAPADDVDDFAFEFSGQLEMGSGSPLTADELFEQGMIRPLKPPPRLQYPPPGGVAPGWDRGSALSPRSPRSPKSPKSPKSPRSFFRPWRKQPDDFDPFARAIEETTRGRDRANTPVPHRAARSLSPLRGVFDFGHGNKSAAAPPAAPAGSTGAPASSASDAAAAARWIKGGGSKKWRLRDLLLFRSASEGRATGGGGKDPLRKYTALSQSSAAMLSRKGSAASISSASGGGEDCRNASFRSTDSGSVGGSSRGSRGGGGAGSLHGRRYAEASRAAAEEMRKKTMLPYRQGLFGCLGFNPAINGLARGFSSFSRTRS